jgi:hypothetical protein
MANLTRAQMAERADVTRQAIDKALKRGALVADATGLLDSEHPTNRHWLSMHGAGFDSRGHVRDPAKVSQAAAAQRASNGSAVSVRVDTDPSEGEVYMRVMDFLLATTTATPPTDLGRSVLDDILEGPPDPPDPSKGLFANWSRVGIDPQGADRVLRVALKEGGSPLGLIAGMLEGLRGHLAVHLAALRQAVDANTAAIAGLRRDLLTLENDDLSDVILDRLTALENAIAAPPGETA